MKNAIVAIVIILAAIGCSKADSMNPTGYEYLVIGAPRDSFLESVSISPAFPGKATNCGESFTKEASRPFSELHLCFREKHLNSYQLKIEEVRCSEEAVLKIIDDLDNRLGCAAKRTPENRGVVASWSHCSSSIDAEMSLYKYGEDCSAHLSVGRRGGN